MKTRRLSAADDLSGAIQLLQRFFREENFGTPDHVITANTHRMTALDSCAIFVAEEGEKQLAVATVSMDFGIEFGWSAEMGDLYVVPEWRGRAVSRALLNAVEDFLREKGAAGLAVTLTPHALRERGLADYYQRMGFANEGRLILWRDLKTGA